VLNRVRAERVRDAWEARPHPPRTTRARTGSAVMHEIYARRSALSGPPGTWAPSLLAAYPRCFSAGAGIQCCFGRCGSLTLAKVVAPAVRSVSHILGSRTPRPLAQVLGSRRSSRSGSCLSAACQIDRLGAGRVRCGTIPQRPGGAGTGTCTAQPPQGLGHVVPQLWHHWI